MEARNSVPAQQNWAARTRNSQFCSWASRDRHPLLWRSALAVAGVQRRPVCRRGPRSPSSSASPTPTASANRPPSTPPGRYPYLLVELMAAVSGEPTGSIGGSGGGGGGGGAHGVARREGISPPTTWRLLLRMRDLLPIRYGLILPCKSQSDPPLRDTPPTHPTFYFFFFKIMESHVLPLLASRSMSHLSLLDFSKSNPFRFSISSIPPRTRRHVQAAVQLKVF